MSQLSTASSMDTKTRLLPAEKEHNASTQETFADATLTKRLWRAKFATVSGVILLVLASIMRALIPTITNDVVWTETSVTSPSSTLYQAWVNPAAAGVNIYRSFTFYNLTNPYEVAEGAPPNFVERGPYMYLENRVKLEDTIQWFDNGTVGYQYSSSFVFDASLSFDAVTGEQLKEEDQLLFANAPLIGLTHRLSRVPNDLGHVGWIPVTKQDCCVLLDLMVNATVGPQGIFVLRSVKEVLWGYDDPIWVAVHETLNYLNYTASKRFQTEWNKSYVVPSPYSFRSGQMCPLWDHTDACNSTTNLYTLEGSGALKDGPVDMGHLSQWAGQRRLWWWGQETDGFTGGMEIEVQPKQAAPNYAYEGADGNMCHEVHGSDGLRFGPNVSPSSKLQLFLDMVWRTVPLSYWQDTVIKGIDAHSFSLSQPVLDNSTQQNQECYHMKTYGLLNFSRPLFGPAFATKARFLDAKVSPSEVNYTLQRFLPIAKILNTSTFNASNWLLSQRYPVLDYLETFFHRNSDPVAFRATFESHLDVHGLTGITLNGVAQGDVLTIMKPVEVEGCPNLFASSAKLITTYYPLASVRRSTTVSDSYANRLRTAVLLLEIAVDATYAGIALGACIAIAGAIVARKTKRTLSTLAKLNTVQF